MRLTLMYTHMNKPPGLLLVVEVSFPRYWRKPKKENMKRRNVAYKIRTTDKTEYKRPPPSPETLLLLASE